MSKLRLDLSVLLRTPATDRQGNQADHPLNCRGVDCEGCPCESIDDEGEKGCYAGSHEEFEALSIEKRWAILYAVLKEADLEI